VTYSEKRVDSAGKRGGGADERAVLVLEDGRVFTGTPFGAVGQTLGEAVFSTGMSGYQETLTDPSYHGQIVVATAPQIGNTGWNREDSESRGDKIWVAGYAVRDPSPRASNWRATGTLADELVRQGIVGIAGIDTRAVVRHLRSFGSMKAGVFSGAALAATSGSGAALAATSGSGAALAATSGSGAALADPDELLARVAGQPSMLGADLAGQVSTAAEYVVEPVGPQRFTVAAIDLGIKTNTPRNFARRGIRSHVLPSSVTFAQIEALKPDGVFLSNGPGDPATAEHMVGVTREVLGAGIPLFGICFGNQILGRALGRNTYKMVFGHRGINVPVIDHATGRVAVTAQNHGFALEGEAGEVFDTPFGRAEVSHTCANDGVVEGIRLRDGRAFSVQYHPEAAAGPHDAEYLFDTFVELMVGGR
jgi:carbamoyl-phosphate synthase small subunit